MADVSTSYDDVASTMGKFYSSATYTPLVPESFGGRARKRRIETVLMLGCRRLEQPGYRGKRSYGSPVPKIMVIVGLLPGLVEVTNELAC